MTYKQHTECRVCGNPDLKMYLCLGDMPLSNNLGVHQYDPIHDQKYPLQLMFCEQCGLSQLSIVVAPEILFSNYVYRSSIAKGFLTHCLEMAKSLRRKYKLDETTVHVDIAGNDGALLEQFRNELGHTILNVDPALNLKAICQAARIPTLSEFWGMRTAHMILNGGLLNRASSKSSEKPVVAGADLITATNVFAHVDNVREFLQAVKLLLKKTGVLVMEFPYLIDFLEKNEFDTIYFEHLSYFSVYPLTLLCGQVGLNVMSVSKQEIHGGSVRVEIGYGPQDDTVAPFVMNERQHYGKLERYQQFAEDVQVSILNFKNQMVDVKGTVAGFAASAKGNTLLNCVETTAARLRYIVDETPEKIGRWSPGVRIPIVSLHDMMRTPPDYLVILSWNFATEIMKKCRAAGYEGKFILPIPEFKVLDVMA
jgi:hypothetical protein